MKVIKDGDDIKLDMSFGEWIRMGSEKGWIENAPSMVKTASVKSGYSPKVDGMLKVASAGDIHDVSALPHMILLNSGSESPCFAENLVDSINKNSAMPKTRVMQLDVSQASRRDPAELKKSIASVVTASNTVWKVISSGVPSQDVLKAFTDNSGPMHKSNTWVVFETQD